MNRLGWRSLAIVLSIFLFLNCTTNRRAVVGGREYVEIRRPTIQKGREDALEKKIVDLATNTKDLVIAPVVGLVNIEDPRQKDTDLESKKSKIMGQLYTFLNNIKQQYGLSSLTIVERQHLTEILEAAELNMSDLVSPDKVGQLFFSGVTHLLVEDYDYTVNLLQVDFKLGLPYLEVKYIRSIRLVEVQSAHVLETYWDRESYLVLPDQSNFKFYWEQK